ncbi:MAG: rubredoxin [Solobacterium sp.]|nr:rubredoxin [Solobacterium sp.]
MNAFYRCTKCGYVYDQQKEAVKFRTLSADWKCPECGAEKRDFIRLHRTKE